MDPLHRGEVYLNPQELFDFHKELEARYKESNANYIYSVPWRLMPVEKISRSFSTLSTLGQVDVTVLDKAALSNQNVLTRSSSTVNRVESTGKLVINEGAERAVEQNLKKSTKEVKESHEQSVNYDENLPIYKNLHPSEDVFLTLPDWVKSLHSIITQICYMPSARHFVQHKETKKETAAKDSMQDGSSPVISPEDKPGNSDSGLQEGQLVNDGSSLQENEALFALDSKEDGSTLEIQQEGKPFHLQHLPSNPEQDSDYQGSSIEYVLDKLMNNNYKTSTEALNELYMVFVYVFRSSPPGTSQWMNAQDISAKLNELRIQSNLQDSFTLFNSEITIDIIKRHNKMSIYDFHRESIGDTDIFATLTTTNSAANGAVVNPITDVERMEFYDNVTHLDQECHLELFTIFEHNAIWKIIGNGEIELDDHKTDPNIFRSMIKWVKDKRNSTIVT